MVAVWLLLLSIWVFAGIGLAITDIVLTIKDIGKNNNLRAIMLSQGDESYHVDRDI